MQSPGAGGPAAAPAAYAARAARYASALREAAGAEGGALAPVRAGPAAFQRLPLAGRARAVLAALEDLVRGVWTPEGAGLLHERALLGELCCAAPELLRRCPERLAAAEVLAALVRGLGPDAPEAQCPALVLAIVRALPAFAGFAVATALDLGTPPARRCLRALLGAAPPSLLLAEAGLQNLRVGRMIEANVPQMVDWTAVCDAAFGSPDGAVDAASLGHLWPLALAAPPAALPPGALLRLALLLAARTCRGGFFLDLLPRCEARVRDEPTAGRLLLLAFCEVVLAPPAPGDADGQGGDGDALAREVVRFLRAMPPALLGVARDVDALKCLIFRSCGTVEGVGSPPFGPAAERWASERRWAALVPAAAPAAPAAARAAAADLLRAAGAGDFLPVRSVARAEELAAFFSACSADELALFLVAGDALGALDAALEAALGPALAAGRGIRPGPAFWEHLEKRGPRAAAAAAGPLLNWALMMAGRGAVGPPRPPPLGRHAAAFLRLDDGGAGPEAKATAEGEGPWERWAERCRGRRSCGSHVFAAAARLRAEAAAAGEEGAGAAGAGAGREAEPVPMEGLEEAGAGAGGQVPWDPAWKFPADPEGRFGALRGSTQVVEAASRRFGLDGVRARADVLLGRYGAELRAYLAKGGGPEAGAPFRIEMLHDLFRHTLLLVLEDRCEHLDGGGGEGEDGSGGGRAEVGRADWRAAERAEARTAVAEAALQGAMSSLDAARLLRQHSCLACCYERPGSVSAVLLPYLRTVELEGSGYAELLAVAAGAAAGPGGVTPTLAAGLLRGAATAFHAGDVDVAAAALSQLLPVALPAGCGQEAAALVGAVLRAGAG